MPVFVHNTIIAVNVVWKSLFILMVPALALVSTEVVLVLEAVLVGEAVGGEVVVEEVLSVY